MKQILDQIKHNCPLLIHAELSNTNITDKIAFELIKALETNTSLKSLHLCNTKLSDKTRQELTKLTTSKCIELCFVKNFRAIAGKNVIYHIYK